MRNCILASTLHDPNLILMKLMKPILGLIKALFLEKIVCCTPTTRIEVKELLKREGFKVFVGISDGQVGNYKLAIKNALDCIKNSDFQKIFYIDFDRLIHWINTYPDELSNILTNNLSVEYLHFGRTPRAFKTHPPTQTETERIINEFGSKILNFSDIKDLISVCFIISKKMGEQILRMENKTVTGFYSSWPIKLWSIAESKKYVEVEGLEWETPDQFETEIKEMGYKNWLMKFQSANEWKKRVKFLHDGLTELYQLSDFRYIDAF